MKNLVNYIQGKFVTFVLNCKEFASNLAKGKILNHFSRHKLFPMSERLFDADTYLLEHPAVKNSDLSPYQHFMNFGLKEGHVGYFFDTNSYLEANPDVKASGIDAFTHYKYFGKKEFRDFDQIKISINKGFTRRRDYKNWQNQHKNRLNLTIEEQFKCIRNFAHRPKISLIMPTYNSDAKLLEMAINSVQIQTYDNWELCIADDASTNMDTINTIKLASESDKRIKTAFRVQNGHISEASNTALELANGEFAAFIDHDDTIAPDALFWLVYSINKFPNADMIYSDEDKIDENGQYFDPYFKPDFSYDLLLAQNYICHFTAIKLSKLQQIGGFRKGFEGAQDYDLILRLITEIDCKNIIHIPRVLYHWRATAGSTAYAIGEKKYVVQAGINALDDYFATNKIKAKVYEAPERKGNFRVKYDVDDKSLVSIIIPTRDRIDLLKKCVGSIIARTSYKNYEIIIIDNNSISADAKAYFNQLATQGIKIIHDESVFNYSKLNNLGVRASSGEIIVLMNNDIEIISEDWIQEMLGHAQQEDVGCVGARLWYPNNTIQHAGVVLGLGGSADHINKGLPRGFSGYFGRATLQQNFSAVTAACIMFRKKVFEILGGLDEVFAVDYNDIDFCLRAGEIGLRIVFTPYAEMYHYESATRGNIKNINEQIEFLKKWEKQVKSDPFYNSNLSLEFTDYSYANPPRFGFLTHLTENIG